ncbi:PF07364 family protein [Bordetella bronchiseptica MBORD675]|nr:hypothetical protein B9G73_15035 [Bordetella bronchiseptica]KAK67409.1 PF07364 family protein [Bordetella bronchiseptica MO211]KCV40725.1 PF07364 family protein [Bordetella bronchiseptica 345]KCV52789.1 PF07364 family protein [Bordetella bronchiseptica 7E71]KDC42123.1 PF07364 family protein [Bordetella bronchiseptica GA96-01]KDC91706.1 PF07364 family protein [Bordetella bronchiseptica MBORD675]KDD58916.1 PF07364 family protein [Bordetella bronchiseptica OSU553]KDD95746.1 PF07364 family pr
MPAMQKTRIAVLHFSHETVTFLERDTELDDFVFDGSPCRDEELLGYDAKGYLGGFVQCAREYTEVELVGIESPLFPKTGIGSGWVTHEAYEHFLGIMLDDLAQRGPFDGVYMALHGAMAVRGVERPEADIARRVRRVVGEAAILAATFDPHGNEDEQFLQAADLAFCVKYFPHYDMHLQGERAARTMVRAIRGEYRPATMTVKVPILTPTVLQWTGGTSPWLQLVHRALTWEAREPDAYVNVFFGFPWADVPDVGMTIQTLTNGKPELAQRIARDMAQAAWRARHDLLNAARIEPIERGVASARQETANGNAPVVLADYSDRSGAATWTLQELVRTGARRTLIATVADYELASRLKQRGARAGDAFDEQVGGRVDDSAGEPVRIQGRILGHGQSQDGTNSRSDWYTVAFGDGNVLVVSAYLMQITEREMLEQMGMTLADFDIFVIKSRAHFRRGFDDSGFARTIILVEPPHPFLGTIHLDALPYRNVKVENYFPYGKPDFNP